MPEQIDWEKILEEEGLGDIDKEEGFYQEEENNNRTKVSNIINFNTFNNLKEYIEKEKGINIKFYTNNGGKIEFYTKSGDLIGKIWYDGYKLEPNNIDFNHLGIEIYWDYQGKGYSKLLYKLYYLLSLENNEVIFPEYDLATKNSRIKLLLSLGYRITQQYINGIFINLLEEDIEKIIKDVENNFYGKQEYTIKLELQDNEFIFD